MTRDATQAVWVRRTASPILAALIPAAILVQTVRRGRGAKPPAVAVAAGAGALLVLGTVRVVVSSDGLRVGFGPWGWPERRFPLASITAASVEAGVRAPRGSVRENGLELLRRLVVGLGYRFVPGGARVMLGFGDVLAVRLDSGRTFGVTVDDAERGAELLNRLIESRAAAG